MADNSPLRPLVAGWHEKLKLALEHKKPFQEDADEAMKFYDSENAWMFRNEECRGEKGYIKGIAPPAFRMTLNRVWEFVRIFGGVIHHRNPTRRCTPEEYPEISPQMVGIFPQPPVPQMDPRTGQPVMDPNTGQMVMMPDPMMMQYQQMVQQTMMQKEVRALTAELMEIYLNYTPNELDLKQQNRDVVDEALIKGAGCWFTELYQPPESDRVIPGSFYENFDNVVWDPDADKFDDVLWIARRRCHPKDLVLGKFPGVNPDDIKPQAESYDAKSSKNKRGYENDRRNGKTNDLVTYWEIYSKTGFGDRLKDADEEIRGKFDNLGPYCYVVVCEGCDYPLNAPPELVENPEALKQSVSWPIPFYKEINGWPCTILKWHGKPKYSYPVSPIKPGIGQLRFINWALSFMASKIAQSNQTLVAVAKAAEKSLKDQLLNADESGFRLVEISEATGRKINEIIQIFNMPGVTADMWNIIKEVGESFEKAVALTELAYGMSRSAFRSAAEASVKAEQISVRPDDMADILENALSMLSRKEAYLAAKTVTGQDVAPMLGPLAGIAWDMHIASMDDERLLREYDFRIESGSARKPNPGAKVEQMNAAMQIFMPVAQARGQAMGDWSLFNALAKRWGKVMDTDVGEFLLPMGPPPMPPQGPPGPPQQGGPPPGPQGPPPGG